MSNFSEHPTVRRFRQKAPANTAPVSLDAEELRRLCLEAGADDVGFVELDRRELAAQRAEILAAFAPTKTLISFVCRMHRENVRSPARSVANVEFHHVGHHVETVAHRIVSRLEQVGVRALYPAMGFPMEMGNYPDQQSWVVSHKPVAVAAGLGHMGIHRNVIHPRFGNFILLGTLLIDREVSTTNRPIDYNPCLECNLCVVACPVGAISADGHFNFSACYTHNYREFMGGFTDWIEELADSKNAREYRQKTSTSETASIWQSLSYGPNYKAAYCMAVCPAGEDIIGQFLGDRKQFVKEVVQPLQQKEETIYVVAGSDAEAHVNRRFPHKQIKRIGSGLRLRTVQGFLRGLSLTFQRQQSEGLNATFHFTFTGAESIRATVVIRNRTLQVNDAHQGTADIQITADSQSWLRFLGREQSIFWAILSRKIRIKGSPRLLLAFGKCFPSG